MTHHTTKSALLGQVFFVIFVAVSTLHAQGATVCGIKITTCPENLDGSTLIVPQRAEYVAARIRACNLVKVEEAPQVASAPPTVMFIIDHSGSMTGTGYAARDQWGARFTVTRQLLDTLYKQWPRAQVGFVVFREVLWFDKGATQYYYSRYLNTMPQTYDGVPNQAYMPPLILDSTYQAGKKGIDIIKDALATDTVNTTRNGQPYSYLALRHVPSFTAIARGNTNINIAMLAAREAFKSAIYPKSHQFSIFLSDGEPFGRVQAGLDSMWFVKGDSLPTTFTVYFTPPNEPVPPSIIDMTNNIRLNEYSFSNRYSDIWDLQASHQSLFKLLMDKVVQTIRTVSLGVPTGMTVVDGTQRYNSGVFLRSDSSFLFSRRFDITSNQSEFKLEIRYLKTDVATSQQRDTTHTIQFTVIRQGNAALPEGVELICEQDRYLELYYNGRAVSEIKQYMDTLEVRLSLGTSTATSAAVTIANMLSPHDTLQLNLRKEGDYWTGRFPRQLLETANRSDNILQHRTVDTFYVGYRNPANTADFISIQRPFSVSKIISVNGVSYFDTDADGYMDSVFIGLDGDFAREDLPYITQLVLIPSSRGTVARSSISTTGVSLIITPKPGTLPSTSIGSQERVIIGAGQLSPGNWLRDTEITPADRMGPVILMAQVKSGKSDTSYVEFTFSESVRDVNRDNAFIFKAGDSSYTLALQQVSRDGVIGVFAIKDLTALPPQSGDSVFINPAAQVADGGGIVQGNPLNRRALVSASTLPFGIKARAGNNPMTGEVVLPVALQQLFGIQRTSGTVIAVEPTNPLFRVEAMKGTVSIYDVVKNQIVKDQEMKVHAPTKRLYFLWDGTNLNGRKVATGTYLAVIRVTNHQGTTEKTTLRIGVKR